MIKNILKFFTFCRDKVTCFGFDFVTWCTVLRKSTFNDNDIAEKFRFIRVFPAIGNFNDDGCGTNVNSPHFLMGANVSPSLIRCFRLDPRFVAVAFPPRQMVRAVKIADFPEPLWPIIKLIWSPKGISRRLWHYNQFCLPLSNKYHEIEQFNRLNDFRYILIQIQCWRINGITPDARSRAVSSWISTSRWLCWVAAAAISSLSSSSSSSSSPYSIPSSISTSSPGLPLFIVVRCLFSGLAYNAC